MFDGMDGLRVLLLRLKPAFDSGELPPVLFVAPDANPNSERRGAEYLRGFPGGSDDFAAHERWFLDEVMPWAQRALGASTERGQVVIAGFSNGADLALALANSHADLFGGVLAHSPVGADGGWIERPSEQQRWVVTGGTAESRGSVRRTADVPRQIISALERNRAPLYSCIGPWAHQGPAWRDLSPGAIVWLLELSDDARFSTPQETRWCQTNEEMNARQQ